jgi:hypothetical protein
MDPPAESFLAETLAQARAYRALMVCDADVEYPPLAVVASGCIPAPIAYFRPSSSGVRLPAATAPGDGRVPLAKAHLPAGVPLHKPVCETAAPLLAN